MELLELLLMPEAVVGCLVGLLLAGAIHWFGPQPEPVVFEAGLVALGFVGGLLVGWLTERKNLEERRPE